MFCTWSAYIHFCKVPEDPNDSMKPAQQKEELQLRGPLITQRKRTLKGTFLLSLCTVKIAMAIVAQRAGLILGKSVAKSERTKGCKYLTRCIRSGKIWHCGHGMADIGPNAESVVGHSSASIVG